MIKTGNYRSIIPKSDADINGIIHKYPKIKRNASSLSVAESKVEAYGPQNAIDPYTNKYFHSNYLADDWFMVTFPKNSLFITNYTIQTYYINNITGSHLKQWVAEGLDASGNWIKIDEELQSKLNSPYEIQTKRTTNFGPFSSFRINRTGKSYFNNYALVIHNIDFFGVVDISTCLTINKARKPVITQLLFVVLCYVSR